MVGASYTCAAQQQTAIYERYLDTMDAKIEGEHMEDALLGKFPTEITQLYKPLPSGLKPELRENIAAAAVGKPVKLVAEPPSSAPDAPPTLTPA